MRLKTAKTALALLLAGTIAAACPAFGVSAAQVPQQTVSASASAGSKVYVANHAATIPDGRYFIYNTGTGTVMTGAIESSNHSFPSYKSGSMSGIVTDVTISDDYFYTINHQNGDYYTIRNKNGQYLDIVTYGQMAFTATPVSLKCSLVSNQEDAAVFNISKQVGDTEYSISMYADDWFTVHQTSRTSQGQMMQFYRLEESGDFFDVINQIKGLFPAGDEKLTKVSAGYSESEIRTLMNKATAYSLPDSYQYLLQRALSLVTGTPASQLPRAFTPIRNGKNIDLAGKLNKSWFATDRMPTAVWTSPGEQLEIYVTAGANDPLPSIMFTQHISDCHEEKTVTLQRGRNVITTPQIHADFSTYQIPTVEPGGLIYIINPYTEQQQSDQVRVFIKGGDDIPTFGFQDDTKDFLSTLMEYNSHYQNKEKGYHNVCELYTKYSYVTLTLERALEAYVSEGLDPHDTMKKWDAFIDYLMAFDGLRPEQYAKLRLGVKVNQPYAGAYATPEMICIQDNNWLASFIAGRFGWGFPHEVGHTLDDTTRTYMELTNNMWSIKYVLDHYQYDSIAVRKEKPKYDLKLIAPEDQNSFWSPTNSADTTYWWCLYLLWDLEVYHHGYWGEVDTMFRNGSCGNDAADGYLKNVSVAERLAAYSSKSLGIDLTYYFRKYGYLTNVSADYQNAINSMNLSHQQPKFYYYNTDTYTRAKGSNVGKGSISLSTYQPSSGTMYFNIPASCADNHLGFEIVKNGKVMDFTWEMQYTDTSGGTYTVNAYDTSLNVYSSITFNTGDAANNRNTAMVNGVYYKSLNEAIQAAPSGATVLLSGSTYIDSSVTINKAITIKPAESGRQILICNRERNAPCFVVTSGGSLTIRSYDNSPDNAVILDNVYSHESAGASIYQSYIKTTGGSVTLGKGVTLQNCAANVTGPAIFADGASVRLDGCILQRNSTGNAGLVYLTGGSVLTSANGTKIRYNQASTGSAVYCATANDKVILSNTEISYNFCGKKGGAAIDISQGSAEIGTGTSIHDNADSHFSINSAMLVGTNSSVRFSGNLNITDQVTLCTTALVDPSVTGKLQLRAEQSRIGIGFLLASPTSGQFTQNVLSHVFYQNSRFAMQYTPSSLTIGLYQAPQASVSVTPSPYVLGKTFTIKGAVTDGSAPFQYKIEAKQSTDASYTVLKAYNATDSCTWKPAKAGQYFVRISVKDAKGNTSSAVKSVTVVNNVSNQSTISAQTITLGASARVTCAAADGTAPYTYAVSYKPGTASAYTTVQDFSTNRTVDIKPSAAGTYTVLTKVRDSSGTISEKTFSLTVQPEQLVNQSTISAVQVALGGQVTIKCAAKGGTSPYTYGVSYKQGSAADYVQYTAFSSSSSVVFKPDAEGTYSLRVRAKDKDGRTADKYFSLTVTYAPYHQTTISRTVITLGETVTVNCQLSGSGVIKYGVYYKGAEDTEWTTAQDYAVNKTVTVKPATASTYTIRVKAKDGTGRVTEKDFSVRVNPALKNTSKVSSSAIVLGSTVKVSCASTGGTGTKQYAVYYKSSKQTKWTKAADYSTGTTVTIKPRTVAAYTVRIKAKDTNGNVVNRNLTVKVYAALKNLSKLSASSMTVGSTVKVTCASSGGYGTKKYAVYYKSVVQKSWTKAKDYSTGTTVLIKPKTAAVYTIRVKVKDAKGTVVRKNLTLKTVAPLRNQSIISASAITLGNTVKVTCASTGGTGTKKYAVYYKSAKQTSWTKVKDYSTATSVTIRPRTVASYTVRVKVKDGSGKVVNKDMTVTVKAALKNTSRLSASTITLGKAVTVSCASTGGTGTKKYAVFYKRKSQTAWTQARTYGTGTSVKITPKAATTYIVRVKAKDSSGKIVNKDMTLYVKSANALVNTSEIGAASVTAGGTVKVRLLAEKGTAPYYFRVERMKAGDNGWTLVKDYSEVSSVSVRIPGKGTYQIKVTVTDISGKIAIKYFTVTGK